MNIEKKPNELVLTLCYVGNTTNGRQILDPFSHFLISLTSEFPNTSRSCMHNGINKATLKSSLGCYETLIPVIWEIRISYHLENLWDGRACYAVV